MEITKPYKVGNFWTNLVDSTTGEPVNFEVVTTWWDGTPMDDSRVDGVIYRKLPASSGGGYVKRVMNNSYQASWWGAFPEQEVSTQLQAAIDRIALLGGGILELQTGTYHLGSTILLKNNVFIQGTGTDKCFITETTSLQILLSSAIPASKVMVQTEDLLSGATSTQINNTLLPGDIIRFKSTDRFTADWDNGTAIRDYYQNGELLKVKSATETEVTFSSVPFLNFPLASVEAVDGFTPNKGGGIDGVTLVSTPGRETYSVGMRLNSWEGFTIGELGVIGFTAAGVQVNRCYDTKVGTINSIGGSSILGLNYGLSINDGTKYTTVGLVEGVNNRHVIAAGGSGYAIPMYADIGCAIGKESVIYTADCHGNTAFFTFHSIIGNLGFSISGIGHKVLSATVESGALYFGYEGGINLMFQNITGHNISHVYSNHRIKDSDFNNINLSYNALSPDFQPFSFRDGSSGNRFSDIRLENSNFDPFKTNAENLAPFNSINYRAIILQDSWILDKISVRGFPVAAHMLSPNISLSDLRTEDCGWDTGFTIESSLFITNSASNSSVVNSSFYITPGTTVSYATGGHIKSQAGGSASNVVLTNVTSTGEAPAVGIALGANFSGVLMINVNLSGVSSVTATGRFIKNSVVADSLNPPLFSATPVYTGDLNTLLAGGQYYAAAGADNKPSTAAGFVSVSRLDGNTVLQEFVQASTASGKYYRIFISGVPQAWRLIQEVSLGTTAQRPAAVNGRMYYDTTISKPIWYNGTAWVDATGATV